MKHLLFLLAALCLSCPSGWAQVKRQARIDSMLLALPRAAEDTHKVKLLNAMAYDYPYINPDEGIRRGQEALDLAIQLKWLPGVAAANYAIGGNYTNKSDYANALDYQYRALRIYEKVQDKQHTALMYRNIAIIYRYAGNPRKALQYNQKSLAIYETLHDTNSIATIYNNMANAYNSLGDQVQRLAHYQKALHLYTAKQDREGMAFVTGNIANFYAIQGAYEESFGYYFSALAQEKAMENPSGITRNMGNIGETYLDIYRDTDYVIPASAYIPATRRANLDKAIDYLSACVAQAKALKQNEYRLAFEEVLSEAYRLAGDTKAAFATYKDYIAIRDSIHDVEKYNAATRQELNYEYGKREDSIQFEKRLTDVKLDQEQRSRRREQVYFTVGLVMVLVFSAFMFNRWRVTQRQKKVIEQEQERSEALLLNILPAEVATELKATGTAQPRHFASVTVLFTDFKNFTQLSERLSPAELVQEINHCYSAFDEIVTRHGVEKIKTIGDSYMCAGGLPLENSTHPWDVVAAGLAFQEFMVRYKAARQANGQPWFDLRVGIHTGSVVAGIVGHKKFAYDIWGDTVNTASRMESSGEPGRVNISATTFQRVQDRFACTCRGKVEAKNKGEIEMYFVEGPR